MRACRRAFVTRSASSKSVPFGNPAAFSALFRSITSRAPSKLARAADFCFFESAHLKKFLLAVNLRVKKLCDFDRFLLWRMGFSELQKSPGKKSGVKPHAVPERSPNRNSSVPPPEGLGRGTRPLRRKFFWLPVECSRIGAWPVRPRRVHSTRLARRGRFIGTPSKVRFTVSRDRRNSASFLAHCFASQLCDRLVRPGALPRGEFA